MTQNILDASLISSSAKDSLHRLPDEVLLSIPYYLTPQQSVRLGASCRRLYRVIDEPLLWRYYCDTVYSYWKHKDDVDPLILERHPNAPWRRHYVERVQREGHSRDLFESVLSTQHERYAKIQQIADNEYEAREMLLHHCAATDDCKDVLARRYYAEATLGLIHRTKALQTWSDLAAGRQTTLEAQLSAFDSFVIGKRWGTIPEIDQALNAIASEIRRDQPGVDDLDEFQRSLSIVRYLREHRYVGLDDGTRYHSMKNNYLSFILLNQNHASLPLQSAVIFCSVARRLGISAYPCNYPAHVYVVVMLDGADPSELSLRVSEKNCFFLDPWSRDEPVPLEDLTARLRMFGIGEREFPSYLAPAPVRSMVLRTCRNIMHSYQDWRRGILPDEPPLYNSDAFYSFLWCMALIEDGNANEDALGVWHRPHLAHLPQFFRENYPEDLRLMKTYLGPLFAAHPQRQAFQFAMAEMMATDLHRRPVMRRNADARHVKYKIGQLLQHKRYGYVGVVRRWDANCKAADAWIAEMGVEKLSKGKWQPFYDVLAEDRSQRYLAEENIEPIHSDPPDLLLRIAGKYFKRWDMEKRIFISNVRDEYPDD